ncbi:EF-P lysine aminoacylase EpmA [Salinisphaera hydrothermalis]|uniref:PoxB regulator PoxA n=1 Tax=Salinisphaera hydrothermalis (strain C41B8) TaxID=1304275 RepID=A0A084IQ77_SALHC|nr:EF-P lysine aminoacylase EpmA [Salinisphaera hydrothermalis]KEZ78861.1 poxB regulator PoxA [Salinisphaera hydrothermalis C41B8]
MSDYSRWRSGLAPGALAARARLMGAIRVFMAEHGLLEVDTPLLSAAAPSERALECLAVDGAGYLVPSPEHALKRLLAEGAGSLYQLGHVFRAGESGRWHNPEFTMLEWYGVGDDMFDAIARLTALLPRLGTPPIERSRTYREVFQATVGVDPLVADAQTLAGCAQARGVAPSGPDASFDRVFWLDLLMATCVQPTLGGDGPEIVTHFPADDAVLVAADPDEPRQALRFECFWQGVELANGARELTDAGLARQRMMREQNARAAQGSPVPPIDEALLAAMRAGLPPCAGVALGVDRLLALLQGCDAIAPVLPFAAT